MATLGGLREAGRTIERGARQQTPGEGGSTKTRVLAQPPVSATAPITPVTSEPLQGDLSFDINDILGLPGREGQPTQPEAQAPSGLVEAGNVSPGRFGLNDLEKALLGNNPLQDAFSELADTPLRTLLDLLIPGGGLDLLNRTTNLPVDEQDIANFEATGLRAPSEFSFGERGEGGSGDDASALLSALNAGTVTPGTTFAEQRNTLLDQLLQQMLGTSRNPFGPEIGGVNELATVLQSGIGRANDLLGPDANRTQFESTFNNPDLSEIILGQELGIRQDTARESLGDVFSGDAFSFDIDDDIINSIVEERSGPVRQAVSNQVARGNFNALGGQEANAFIGGEQAAAGDRVRDVGANVLTGNQEDVGDIRDRASQEIGSFQLGDDLFDVSPFAEQRQNLIADRTASLGSDISSALGTEPLFSTQGALQAGGGAQGLVSGTPSNQAFLDAFANREARSTKRNVGTAGTGAF